MQKLGDRPKYTGDDAGSKWLQETTHKRTHREDMRKLAWLQPLLRGRVLAELTRDDIAAIGERKLAEASGPTANRHLALVRAILRKACFEWEWIDKVPKVKMYQECKRRVRWITPEQARRLLTHTWRRHKWRGMQRSLARCFTSQLRHNGINRGLLQK